jgi:hypothetical protein
MVGDIAGRSPPAGAAGVSGSALGALDGAARRSAEHVAAPSTTSAVRAARNSGAKVRSMDRFLG